MISQILIVMIAAIAVSIFAERRGIQAPLLLALVGLAASFIPGLQRLELDPEIILTVVLPPLLFSAAREFSFVSFLMRLPSIVNLGLFLIVVTTGIVGFVAARVVPGLTLPAALVLAAVVSPPDAVTAVAIGRKLGLPGGVMTLLKGESLINDAAALTLFTFAAASVAGTPLFIKNIFLYLGYSAVVGVIVGVVLGALVHRTRLRITNASLVTVLSVLVPFTAYLVAEELGASGVLAVVAAGFSLGHNSSDINYASRIQERQFWRTADTLLEAFVFAYIGLQLRFVIEDAARDGLPLWGLLGSALLVLLAVIVVRLAWIYLTAAVDRWRYPKLLERVASLPENHRRRSLRINPPFPWRENLVIGWTGMRGVVTLAAAAGVPLTTLSGAEFPGRGTIQAIAFVVTIGTLLLQGLTLPALIHKLKLSDDGNDKLRTEQSELAETLARDASASAITRYRDQQTDPDRRALAESMLQRVSKEGGFRSAKRADDDAEGLLELTEIVLTARRDAVVKARDERRLDDEIMREVLDRMDLEQAVIAGWSTRLAG
jgi:Na+/H+ antiporter